MVGLLAIAALAALTVGVPFALITVFGLPVPHAMPSLTLLTRQLDVPAILKVLSLLVWLAWIQLVCCVIAEIRAAVRNAGMPRRVPLAGGTQALVHQLVTAALLVFAATAALSPALAHQAAAAPHPVTTGGGRVAGSTRPPAARDASPPAAPDTSSSAARHSSPPAAPDTSSSAARHLSPSPAPDPSPSAARDSSPPDLARPPQLSHSPQVSQSPRRSHSPQAGHLYVVKPPVGRFHESLWEIAQKYLGDGRRYREIFELNKNRVQPDGSRLTIASLIRPGWVLDMPRDAHGPGLEAIPAGDSHSAPAGPVQAIPPAPAPGGNRAGEHSQADKHGHARREHGHGAGEHGHAAARRSTGTPGSTAAGSTRPGSTGTPGSMATRSSRAGRPSPALPGGQPLPTAPPTDPLSAISCTPGA